jgi:Predicted membrane protein (DUF2306)
MGTFNLSGRAALQTSAKLWFVTAVVGQWLFASYLILFYGRTAVQGDLHLWKEKLTHGYVPGDWLGNTAVAAHLLMAVIILMAGPLQLVPQIRARLPVFHRWNGRIYLLSVTIASIAGLFMLMVHGTVGGAVLMVAQSVDAALILVFAAFALRTALLRDFKRHRQWALRLFMVVSAVWFFRIGLMLWLLVHQAPVGFDPDTFTGPFVTFLAFSQYLIPLFVLELYFRAQDSVHSRYQVAMAILLTFLTLAMAAGIFGAFMGLWLPNI